MRRLIPVIFTVLLALGPVAPAQVPKTGGGTPAAERDAFFAGEQILELAIELGPKELEALRRAPRDYVKATLKTGDKIYPDVGLHLRGAAGSFRDIDDKPGLTLNMDKYVPGQRLRGMDKFYLANSVQDPSYVAELLCGELFRAAAVPAARVGHAVVTLNGRRRGLYYLKEGYDKDFLFRHFGSKNGNFYDGGFLRDLDQPLELLSGKNDVPPHSELKALMAAAQEADRQKRFQRMEKLLDMERFLSFLALEVLTWDWDGYPMNRNNYRLYHDPLRARIVFIPSGMDQMFGNPDGPMLPDFQGQIARGLMETAEGRERYYVRLAEIVESVFQHEALAKRLEQLQARVQPALTALDAGAGRDYPNHIRRLRDGIRQRAKSIAEQLNHVQP